MTSIPTEYRAKIALRIIRTTNRSPKLTLKYHKISVPGKNIWELLVLHYNKIMVIYPYPFLMVIIQFFYWIIFTNDCICIITGSPR